MLDKVSYPSINASGVI